MIHQAEDAEAFISALVQAECDGDPAGLLWVRQGLTRLEGEGDSTKEKDAAKAARRNLMTSVTGEVEALTGGRRMDKALARTHEESARYVTTTGRPHKSGSLSDAEALVTTLTEDKTRLESTARQLTEALARRRIVLKDLASLTAPEEVEARQTRLIDGTRNLDEAKRHADALATSALTLQSAELAQANLSERLANLHRAQSDCATAAAALQAAEANARTAKEARAQAEETLTPHAAALAAARSAKIVADAELAEANRAFAGQAAAARRKDLTERIAKARALTESRAPLVQAAAPGPNAKALAHLQSLSQTAALERALRDRSAAQISFHHTGPACVTTGDTPVPETPLPVLSEARFDMPGLEHFTVKPAAGYDSDDLARAEAAFAAALSWLGFADLATAQAEAAARTEATASLRDLDAALATLAPQGLPALEAEPSAFPEDVPAREDMPTVAEGQSAADRASIALQSAKTAHNEACDRYFEPVLAELRPLLRMLWPDAELRFNGESRLPSVLVRNGRKEPLSILSSGTQEQIAFLVRLAFARLLATRGHHTPIIFDDALVYIDGDRIEKMFNVPHALASGQQIIVLSCRQRTFRDLGGAMLNLGPMIEASL